MTLPVDVRNVEQGCPGTLWPELTYRSSLGEETKQ